MSASATWMAASAEPGSVEPGSVEPAPAEPASGTAQALRAAVSAEIVKIRSVRSTAWTWLAAAIVGNAFGYLCCRSIRGGFQHMSPEARHAYDPMWPSLFGVTMAQYPLLVFAVLAVTSEYSTGTIRASLAAVPRRGRFYAGKLLGAGLTVLCGSLVIVATLFALAQATLGPRGARLDSSETVLALLGAELYLVMISLFAMGIAMVLRSAVATLTILLPVLLVSSQGATNAPGVGRALSYLPNQAGAVLFHGDGDIDVPDLGPGYGHWAALGILLAWTAAAITGGYLTFRHRDG